MKILGIVAEYNPFHLGHQYQLQKARELSNCDAIAVVMSGNFVQRGEPALIDKWHRASAAICGGADLVIELPLPFACQNAELFALSAMRELKKLGISYLSFGCEDVNTDILEQTAYIQMHNSDYSDILRCEIKKGSSYPTAVTNTIQQISGNSIQNIINSPNNILALEYIKSCEKLGMSCDYIPVKRIGSNHNDEELNALFSSATAIRNQSITGDTKYVKSFVTEKSYENICDFYCKYGGFNTLDKYLDIIYYKVLELGKSGLNDIYEVSEGLNNKLYDNVFKHKTVDDYIASIKSKRYTYAKIRRILLNIILDIRCSDMKYFIENNNNYVKVLSANQTGAEILKSINQNEVYAITRFADYRKYGISYADNKLFSFTDKSTNIYYIPFSTPKINMEYTENIIYIKNTKNK